MVKRDKPIEDKIKEKQLLEYGLVWIDGVVLTVILPERSSIWQTFMQK